MTNDIKVGDLVWVKYPSKCCGCCLAPKRVFNVIEIVRDCMRCTSCGAITIGNYARDGGFDSWHPLYRLEKFRDFPVEELTDSSTDKPLQKELTTWARYTS